ncbi:phosphoribosylglycinamide formyltransferase [Alteribacillus sp. JSM 102045]|uniref:phosphoribosylglycinamide formyltransferase n=1 Tax=Alteribacillus sp. JSM 102045 TaxID=1562101 RepID=UPI0035BFD5FB
MKLAVFASGSGSNFQAIVDAVEEGRLQAEISLLVCDKPGAYAEKRAQTHGISVFSFHPKEYSGKAAFEEEIVKQLRQQEIDMIILAGYMRLIGPTLLHSYEGRIFNIHPSLLPAFPGKDAIGQAWRAGVKVTGATIHMVDEGMDTGTIIAQEAIPVKATDSLQSLTKAIQAVEHRLYPDTIQSIIEKRTLEGSQIKNEH